MPKGKRLDTTNLATGSYAFSVASLSGYEVIGPGLSLGYVRILYEYEERRWTHTLYPKTGRAEEFDRLLTRCQRRLRPALELPAALARTKKTHAKKGTP